MTSFIQTSVPGVYPEVNVQSQPVGISSSGNIVIIGEATGGAANAAIDSVNGDILKNNHFSPSQLDAVAKKYVSGPIVDAFNALASPSADTDIAGSANNIYIVKTNISPRAQATLAATYGTLADLNFGVNGNKYFYQVTESQSEVAPTVTSGALAFLPKAEHGTISVKQSSMADGDYFYIQTQDGIGYAVALDTTGGALVTPNGAHYTGAAHKVLLDVSAILTDAALATAIIGAFNALTGFVAKVLLIDHTSAVIGINQVSTGAVIALPNAYSHNDALSGAAVGACAVAYATTQHGDASDGTIYNGLTFSVRLQGAAAQVITLSSNEADHDSIAHLVIELNSKLPAGIIASAAGSSFVLSLVTLSSNAANALGYGRCFELIDSTPGDLAALELAADLIVSSAEPEVQVNIARKDKNVSEEYTIDAAVAMTIGYEGTSALLTINATTLSTTIVGGLGSPLSLKLADFVTVSDLAAYINSQTAYTCAVIPASTQMSPFSLDRVVALGIASSSILMPGRLKEGLYNFVTILNQSPSLSFAATAVAGLPQLTSYPMYLSGGAQGPTLASDIIAAISDLEGIAVNFVVPLFSRDASLDIADGLTDIHSTYTIAATNAAIKSHVLKMSVPKLKGYRSAFLSMLDTYLNDKAQAQSLAHARVSLCIQKPSQVNSAGIVVSYQPWYGACIAAGMQAAGFYKSIVNKFANVISFIDPVGFDSGNPGDLEDALNAGLLIMERGVVGDTWVSDQTTYGIDTNFVYNSIQAMYAADLVTTDICASFKSAFLGKSLADVDTGVALAYLSEKMRNYKAQKLIAASNDAPMGYKNAKITISAPVMSVSFEIKLATAIYFIPVSINISQVELG